MTWVRWGALPIGRSHRFRDAVGECSETAAKRMGSLGDPRACGVAASNVGGAAHNGPMNNMEICERCEGSGADPMQAYFDDVVELCIECRGDGVLRVIEVSVTTDRVYEELLPLSA